LLSSEGRQRRINTKRGLWSTKNNKGKKETREAENLIIAIY
jgi:hypothetical protein